MGNLLLANLSATVDVIAIIFVGVFALIGFIKGFTKTFFSTFGTIIGLLLAVLLSKAVTQTLEDKFSLVTTLSDRLAGGLTSIFGDGLMNTTLRDATNEMLAQKGLSWLSGMVGSLQADGSIPLDTTLNQIICPTFAYYIGLIISVIGLFIIFKILFFLIGKLVKRLYENRIVATVDRTLGLVFGLIRGIVTFELIVMVISIIPIAFFQDISVAVQTSIFAKFLMDINVYNLIMQSISTMNIKSIIQGIVNGAVVGG
jgi:uncharacterized membrane protein required for colicin V production